MLNGQNTVIEFWDSKLSGKKKIALNSKIIYFNKFEGDVIFGLKFACGYINYEIKQLGEDKYNLYINGNRFNDLMAQEKYEKHNSKYQKQMEKQKQKKIEDDYYKRALKYNGNDYYEGKEQALLNNPKNNNKGYMQYDYDLIQTITIQIITIRIIIIQTIIIRITIIIITIITKNNPITHIHLLVNFYTMKTTQIIKTTQIQITIIIITPTITPEKTIITIITITTTKIII